MAGNSRYELNSTSSELGFVGNYPNGQRGNHFGRTLDRFGSFREGTENRIVGSGIGTSRGSGTLLVELPPLPQCLMLDPILMADQKYTRFGELRRVIGLSIGSTSEDNSFGATHLKSSPALASEDVKRFKSSVVDTCIKARYLFLFYFILRFCLSYILDICSLSITTCTCSVFLSFLIMFFHYQSLKKYIGCLWCLLPWAQNMLPFIAICG